MKLENVPNEMLAARLVEFDKPYKIDKIPTPKDLEPYQILARVAVASLCHTDSMVAGGTLAGKLPFTASHEGVGTVVAVGSDVKSFKTSDRIMFGLWMNRCGKCTDCKGPENYQQYCVNVKICGVNIDGSFAEYQLVDAREASLIPDNVKFEDAAPLACAGNTVFRALKQAKLKEGDWVAFVGAGGGLGHLGCKLAKVMGLKVIGIDARDEGLQLAKESGADIVIDAREDKDKVTKKVQEVTKGEGADATINLSGAKTAAATACAVTKRHAKMIQVAQPDEIIIPFEELIFRDIRVEGSLCACRSESQEMLNLVSKHNITSKTNAVHGLEEIPKLLELAHGGKMSGKGIVIIDQEAIDRQA